MEYSQVEIETHRRLTTDYRYFAHKCLKIIDKDGNIVPFTFNDAQEYIHELVEQQARSIGMVRAIIVKGRQQGCSTYVAGRFYFKASLREAKTVAILSHEAKATKVLFDKVDFFYRHCPEQMRPSLRASNRTELEFDNESRYMVSTAGSENSGRGQTAQYLHASECAYFESDEDLAAGIYQIVADSPGSEIFKESTGNGENGFYQDVMEALKGESHWIVIFVPWYWQREYRATPRPNFEPTDEEKQLQDLYSLDNAQLQWRRNKIVELKSLRKFKQEYPNTLMEAFQASGDKFYDADLVRKAMESEVEDHDSPLVLGVDPARTGDRTVLVLRRGRQILEIIKHPEMDSMRLSGIISNMIERRKIDKVFIDYGLGYGTVDRLRERGYQNIVEGVYFNEAPSDEQFLNKRAEMAFNFRDWLADGEVNIPNDQDMAADIATMPDFKENSRGKISFPSKDDIKKKFKRSPDILDAIMLTFAHPVHPDGSMLKITHTRNTKSGSQLTTLARVRKNKGNEDSAGPRIRRRV